MASDARRRTLVTIFAIALSLGLAHAEDLRRVTPVSPLERGFSGLYNLDFTGAQKEFSAWQSQHPDDPVGPVSEAAGWLFSEFNRLGVLEAQFYEDDDAFAQRSKQSPDPAVRDRFNSAIARAESLARVRLEKDPKDRDALLP